MTRLVTSENIRSVIPFPSPRHEFVRTLLRMRKLVAGVVVYDGHLCFDVLAVCPDGETDPIHVTYHKEGKFTRDDFSGSVDLSSNRFSCGFDAATELLSQIHARLEVLTAKAGT